MKEQKESFLQSGMLKKYWLVFFITLTNVNFLISQINTTFYTQFQEIFQLTNTQQGFLPTMNSVGTILGSIIGGYLADRFNPKRLCVLSCIVCGLAAIGEANIHSYALLLFVYLMLSLSCFVLLNTAYMKCVKLIGTKEEQGKLFGISEASFAIVTLVFYSGFLALITSSGMSFHQALYLVGGLCLVVALLLQLFFKLPALENYKGEKVELKRPGIGAYLKALQMPVTWYNGLVFLGVGRYMSLLFTYMQPRLVNVYLFDAAVASIILLVIRNVLRIILSPLGGTLRDKVGDSFKLMIPMSFICTVLSVAISFLPTAEGSASVLYFLFFVISAVCLFIITPLQYTLITDANVPECYSGTVWGISYSMGPLLGFWVTIASGAFLDNFGLEGYRYVALLTGAFMLVTFIATVLMRRSIKNKTILGKKVQAEVEAGLAK